MAIKLNIEDQRYENAIAELQGYVSQLEDVVSSYHSLNTKVENCYDTDQTRELKELIQTNINNVNQSIGATNLNIQQFQKIKENAATTNQAISSALTEAISIAENIFT